MGRTGRILMVTKKRRFLDLPSSWLLCLDFIYTKSGDSRCHHQEPAWSGVHNPSAKQQALFPYNCGVAYMSLINCGVHVDWRPHIAVALFQ